jgi:hypothetical protein
MQKSRKNFKRKRTQGIRDDDDTETHNENPDDMVDEKESKNSRRKVPSQNQNSRKRRKISSRDDEPRDEENFFRNRSNSKKKIIIDADEEEEDEEEEEKEEKEKRKKKKSKDDDDDDDDDDEKDYNQFSNSLVREFRRETNNSDNDDDDDDDEDNENQENQVVMRQKGDLGAINFTQLSESGLQSELQNLDKPIYTKDPSLALEVLHRLFCGFPQGHKEETDRRTNWLFECGRVSDLQRIDAKYKLYQQHLRRIQNSFTEMNASAIRRVQQYDIERNSGLGIVDENGEIRKKEKESLHQTLTSFRTKLEQVERAIHNMYYCCMRSVELANPLRIIPKRMELDVNNYQPMDIDSLQKDSLLLMHVQDIARTRFYGRCGPDVYERIWSEHKGRRYFTHSWRKVKSIREFIFECADKRSNNEIWKLIVDGRGASAHLENNLLYIEDDFFPLIKKRRWFTSWKNGIYCDTTNDFYEYGSNEYNLLGDEVVCSKHFDLYFDNYAYQKAMHYNSATKKFEEDIVPEGFMNIETPDFEKILNDQQFTYHEKMWMYVLIGRMLYEIKEHDNWQRVPWFYGQAGTGKSLILDVILNFYDTTDVGYVNNTIEKTFYMQNLYEKFLFVIGDVRKQFGIEEGDLAKLISGEGVSIARKNRDAIMKQSSTPFAISSNEFPEKYRNAGGSLLRRLVVFYFGIFITENDGGLFRKLLLEAAAFRKKCNSAYREIAAIYGYGTWEQIPNLPPRFKTWGGMAQNETNVLSRFFSSDRVVLGGENTVPWSVFEKEFIEWCRENQERHAGALHPAVTGNIFQANKIYKLNQFPYRLGGVDDVGDVLIGITLKKAGVSSKDNKPLLMSQIHPMFAFLNNPTMFKFDPRRRYQNSVPKYIFDSLWRHHIEEQAQIRASSNLPPQPKLKEDYNDPVKFGAYFGINYDEELKIYKGIKCVHPLANFILSHPQLTCDPRQTCNEADVLKLWNSVEYPPIVDPSAPPPPPVAVVAPVSSNIANALASSSLIEDRRKQQQKQKAQELQKQQKQQDWARLSSICPWLSMNGTQHIIGLKFTPAEAEAEAVREEEEEFYNPGAEEQRLNAVQII